MPNNFTEKMLLRRGTSFTGEYEIKKALLFFMTCIAGYFSLRQLTTDLRFAKGRTTAKSFSLTINPGRTLRCFPIKGTGRAQLRLKFRRKETSLSVDLTEVEIKNTDGKGVFAASLDFAFNKETLEFNISDKQAWRYGVDLKLASNASSSYRCDLKITLYGGNEVQLPDHFVETNEDHG